MILLFFLKRFRNIKKRKKSLKIIRNYSLLEVLLVISLLFSIVVIGSWWGIKRSFSRDKLTLSKDELISYLNQVYVATVYLGIDSFVEVKRDEQPGFIFQTHFSQPIPQKSQLYLKKKYRIQYLYSIKFQDNLNEDVRFSFDSFLGETEKGILLLEFKGYVQQIEIGKFPIREIND